MDMKAELELLREKSFALEEAVQTIDYEIERAMHAIAAGTDDIGHAMGVLTERKNTQAGFMFELGKTAARIEDLENRIREHDDHQREHLAAEQWQEREPVAEVDHLDWLRPVLDAPLAEQAHDERHPHDQAEERMLAEMHRKDREPDDYLDWWKR